MWWIMRHASAGPTTDAKNDDQRPLDAEGEKQADAAGIALKKLKTPIQACLTSPLTRAQQTAELVCKHIDVEIHVQPLLAGQPISVQELRLMTKPYGNCLLVGHAPCVNLLVYKLTGSQCQITKGGCAQVHEGEVWSMLNASTLMTMAGMEDEFKDPQDVDHRSIDDRGWSSRYEPPKIYLPSLTPKARSRQL